MDELAIAFQKRARLSRSQLHVNSPDLRPISALNHVDIAIPGFVGANYDHSRLCLFSVNPAGGKDSYRPTDADAKIYGAAKLFAEATLDSVHDHFTALGESFIESMPTWGNQWGHVRRILDAVDLPLDKIAYVYLVPFRTRGDNGSRLTNRVLQSARMHGLYEILDLLKFALVVPMDGPSRDCIESWAKKADRVDSVIYYTRKRDAHSDREKTLERLKTERIRLV